MSEHELTIKAASSYALRTALERALDSLGEDGKRADGAPFTIHWHCEPEPEPEGSPFDIELAREGARHAWRQS